MTPSEKYTAAAYLVVFVGLLAYVLIIASKLQRLQRAGGRAGREAARARLRDRVEAAVAEALFWPAILGYGEAAIAYSSRALHAARDLGRAARLDRPDGAPRACRPRGSTASPGRRWAGSLNLFVWFVVGAYLIWGCQPRYRLRRADGDAARGAALRRLAGRRRHRRRENAPTTATSSSTLHVGFVLAAFAGFTLAAALAALYLAEERRLQRHAPTSCG